MLFRCHFRRWRHITRTCPSSDSCRNRGTVTNLLHLSNLFKHGWNERLAEKLAEITGLTQAFFCNSGTEADEAAIKIARAYGHHRGIQRPKIIVMQNAFHGRTLGALSATAKPAYREAFGPLLEGFEFVPFHDLAAIEHYQDDPDVVAVLLEPIQGEAGINIASPLYLKQLRKLCDQQHWLLILDEIQCGLGRTGTWFSLSTGWNLSRYFNYCQRFS